MAIDKNTVPNIDDSDPADYPNGQIKDNDGSDNGTPVNRAVFSDMFETFAKLMRLGSIPYNGGFDNESSGYQYIDALRALAGKNDIIQTIGSTIEIIGGVNTNILVLSAKIEILTPSEFFICKAIVNYSGQAVAKGSTSGVYKAISDSNAFKNGDFVLVTNISGVGLTISTLVTGSNIDSMAAAVNFLKAASQGQENAGDVNTVATTPLTNRNSFIQRVVGSDSGSFLATPTTNGLLSAVDKVKIDTFADPVRNRGFITGIDPGGMIVGTSLPKSGDVTNAIVTFNSTGSSTVGPESTVTITLAHPMTGINYYVRCFLESQGNILNDNNMLCPVFKPIDSTSFSWSCSENEITVQSLRVHFEVVQIS